MDQIKQKTDAIQGRKEFLFGSLIGLCVMLLALLAVVVTPRPRAALAQDGPRVAISIGEHTLTQGDVTYVVAGFYNMPQDPNDDTEFGNISFRYDFERNSNGSWTDANNCLEDLVGGDKFITNAYWRTPWVHGPNDLELTTTCPVGDYRFRVVVKDRDTTPHTQLVTATHDVRVNVGPSVDIEMPSGTYYRGTAINPTIKFKDLAQGANYTYEAWLMARNPPNYADICEGTGLDRHNTFTLNNVSGNPVQESVTVTDSCPTNEYTLYVRLRDSDDRLRGSKEVDFEISTDPNATPSVSVSMSESSPVAPGTEFRVFVSFFDFQPGTDVRATDFLTNKATNQAVGRMDCGGSLVGWGQDVQATINSNPYVNRITIPSDCPVGSYRLESRIDERDSGIQIIAGSIDFTIGDPDLTPTAPIVSNMTAKQNSPFSQQLPEGSGGDGTLSYTATGLPVGLNFSRSTRTIAGTPTSYGESNVTYTVTDADGDPDSVQFNITVNQDFQPSAPTIPNFTGKVGRLFEQDISRGTGADTPLTFSVTNLPTGLTFITDTHKITGTPATVQSPSVTYTVRDADGDAASSTFVIAISANNMPALDNLSATTYVAKVGVPFTKTLPAGTGGDGGLVHTATNLPDGLSFDPTSRRITGEPTTVESKTVTSKVRDEDQDEASTTFTIDVRTNNTPTLVDLATTTYTARVGVQFTQSLPAGSGGDGTLVHTATNLPDGLSFVQATRTVTGRPTTVESKTVTYTVRDEDEDGTSTTFTIQVNSNNTPTLADLSSTTYQARVGSPFTQTISAGSGGDGALVHSATNLPDGLTFNPDTRQVTGTPTTAGSKVVAYKVKDADQDEDSTTFTIAVSANNMPALDNLSATTYVAKVGVPFTKTLPAGTGGDGGLVHTATNLPDGLSFDPTSRRITGEPTTVESKTVTYKVRDDDQDEASTTFTIDVRTNNTPTLVDLSATIYTARVGVQFTQSLAEGSGGDGTLVHTATNLPDGLSFVQATRTVTGRPTTVESKTVTYTVRDEDEDGTSTTFTIQVNANNTPTLADLSSTTYQARVGSPFTETISAGSGGDGALVHSATNLPDGLTFNPDTRQVTGTPTTAGTKVVVYKVKDDDQDEDSTTFTIAVSADNKPTLEDLSSTTYPAKVGAQFTQRLPAGSGGDGDLDYDATGLPPGLTFVKSSRTITGTPTAANSHEVTYTAKDEDGDPASSKFSIIVYAMPSLVAVNDIMAPKDEAFTLVLTAVSGGRAPFDYDATPLPTGLSFVESSLTITGTPTVIEDITVTFSVEDEDGDTASREFKITVSEGDTEPAFPYDIPDFDLRVGNPFEVTLPTATGGNAPYTYTISGHPDTLTFNSDTKILAGTPNDTQTGVHQVTYTVSDSDLDEVSQTFELDIAADNAPSEPSIGDMHLKVGSSLRA